MRARISVIRRFRGDAEGVLAGRAVSALGTDIVGPTIRSATW